MTCECKRDIEQKLLERFVDQTPGRGHKVELQGYGFAVVGNTMIVMPSTSYEAVALVPLKKGGEKSKKITGLMAFTFCPFCGVRVRDDAAHGKGGQG
jgi:hypothetical protein